MRAGIAILAVLAAAAAAALAVVLASRRRRTTQASDRRAAGGTERRDRLAPQRRPPDEPGGGRQGQGPRTSAWRRADFGGEPQLGEGHIRFALNRVPDCVDPVKLQRAEESPVGRGRLVGASFDFPRYSGPNGVLAERIGASGSYSPATRPEIYYHELPAGFYRLVVTLARNNGATTPYHAVTNFQILPRPGHGPKCSGGKVSSAKAAAFD